MNYVVYDLETNGVNVLNNSIMQMSVIATDGQVLLNEYVYPFDGIIDAVDIHKIDEKKLKDNNALNLDELCCMIKKVIRDKYGRNSVTWVAYNNFGFDQMVLEMGFKKVNARMPENWSFMDIFPLVKDKFKNIQPNYKLSSVYKFLVNKNEGINYHCSLDDCICLFEIFQVCTIFEDEFINSNKVEVSTAYLMGYLKVAN